MLDIGWTTIIISLIGSLVSAAVVLLGHKVDQARREGKLGQQVQEHDKRLECNNGKLSEHRKRESDLDAEVRAIKQRMETRDSLWRRNNDDHIKMFSRINALEKGHAAMPGQMAEMMDQRFKSWQQVLKRDIKATIYEIDREKERGR